MFLGVWVIKERKVLGGGWQDVSAGQCTFQQVKWSEFKSKDYSMKKVNQLLNVVLYLHIMHATAYAKSHAHMHTHKQYIKLKCIF